MKINRLIIFSLAAILLGGTVACRDNSRKKALEDERQNWETSLKDSLTLYERQLKEAQTEIPVLRQTLDSLLSQFTPVNNPREVEGYYIYSPARGRYPLTATSVTARLSKSEIPEIIAALKGGNFSAVRFLSDGQSIESQRVPHDQALNYRAAGLNTVAFTGEEVEKMLEFVYNHAEDKIKIEFLNPEAVRNVIMSDGEKATLTATYRLVKAPRELREAEKSIPVISRKIQRLREREESHNS